MEGGSGPRESICPTWCKDHINFHYFADIYVKWKYTDYQLSDFS